MLVAGQDIRRVRHCQRDRLAVHYHQSYQVRSFAKHGPAHEAAHSAYPQMRLFDEPHLNTQGGYVCFMLDFFQRLKCEGRPPLVGNDDVCRYLGPLAGSW